MRVALCLCLVGRVPSTELLTDLVVPLMSRICPADELHGYQDTLFFTADHKKPLRQIITKQQIWRYRCNSVVSLSWTITRDNFYHI